MADLDDIRDRLQGLADDLADVALERLRRAAATGGDGRDERVITRARRAVERAAHLLAGAESEGDPEDAGDY